MSHDDFEMSDVPFNMEKMLDGAIGHILKHQDSAEFIQWMLAHLPNFYTGNSLFQRGLFSAQNSNEDAVGADQIRRLAFSCARMIWNSTPLPRNQFKPEPMPLPGRNQLCYCGSGIKFKHCCIELSDLQTLSIEQVWVIVFDKLGKQLSAKAIRENHVPLEALGEIADEYFMSGQAKKAVSILAPLFEGTIRKTNDAADYALTILCNAYDDLGYHKKKQALLNKITDSVPRSALRSGAWQRLSTIHMDMGDVEEAWQAFNHAQRDDPNTISLAPLEVQLLNAQGDNDKASKRAGFWVRRLRRMGLHDDEMPLNFLIDVVENPNQAFANLATDIFDDETQGLRDWVDNNLERPAPGYQIVDDAAEESIDSQTDGIDNETEFEPCSDQFHHSFERIQATRQLAKLEKQWCKVFHLPKPFSTQDLSMSDMDPWEDQDWVNWLNNNPASFDSFEILDDVLTALHCHPQFGAPWMIETLVRPVINRAIFILEDTLSRYPGSQLAWIMSDNRPVLRSLARGIMLSLVEDNMELVDAWSKWLLLINPNDNHGVRTLVMNNFINTAMDREALALAENYPADMNPEITYGKVLALYRLGRPKEAVEALGDAIEMLDKIPKYLIKKSIRMPKISDDGVIVGGDDQAWLYRESMRGAWVDTPGALDWLKKAEQVFHL